MKILIFGASGSGTSTLAHNISRQNNFVHLDVDDFYWKQTNPPFQKKIPLNIRNSNLKYAFNKNEDVIVSGSMVSWGNEWLTAFDLCVFIRLNNKIRMERLRKREIERYGEKLVYDKTIGENSKAFLEWANKYEDLNFTGRSLIVHEEWLSKVDSKIIRVDGAEHLSKKTEIIVNAIVDFKQKRL